MESLCATGLLLSRQLWVSLRWSNVIAGLAVATAAVLTMFLFIPRGAGIFGSLFPWSLPAFAMAPVSPHRVLAMTVGLVGGIAVGAVACWDLSRRERT
jgi:hypothetical protein